MSKARVRVIVADDEAITRMDLQETLTGLGYLVVGTVGDGESAIHLTRELRPDVVIMDIKMPGVDGIQAAKTLAAENVAPVVLLSAYSQKELIEQAQDAGVVGYLVKPYREADLAPAIGVALSRFEQQSALRKEVQDLKEQLEVRKLVERAKGIIMHTQGLSEAEAFRRIQKMSMDNRKPMRDVAQAIIIASELTAA